MLDRLAATLLTAVVGTSAVTVVHRGQIARITYSTGVSSQASCAAQVVYADGFLQQTAAKTVIGGHVSFAIRVPKHVAVGPAHWTLRCGVTMSRSGVWRVTR